jgi:hypothetical protein
MIDPITEHILNEINLKTHLIKGFIFKRKKKDEINLEEDTPKIKPKTGIILLDTYKPRQLGKWVDRDQIFVKIHDGKYVQSGDFEWSNRKKEWSDSSSMSTGIGTLIPNEKHHYLIGFSDPEDPNYQQTVDTLKSFINDGKPFHNLHWGNDEIYGYLTPLAYFKIGNIESSLYKDSLNLKKLTVLSHIIKPIIKNFKTLEVTNREGGMGFEFILKLK